MTIPVVYNQTIRDVADETRIDARYIGILDLNRTRLNVHSALTAKQDQQDVYRFRVTRKGQLGVGASVLTNGEVSASKNGDIRIEILDRSQRVIADSKALAGSTQKQNYEKAQADKLELQNGDYYVRVTRDRTLSRNQVVEYSFQLRNGNYREDFDTKERPPQTAVSTSAKVLGTSAVTQQLNTYRTSILSQGNIFGDLSRLV